MVSSFFRMVTLLYSFTSRFCNAVSIFSGVASESSLLVLKPLEVFNFAC